MEMNGINIRLVWGLFMIVIYLGMSFLLIFTNLFNDSLSFNMRMIFGFLFFCYTVFRGYRLVKWNT